MANKYKKKENGKNATGRPTKYKPEYCDEVIKYFQKGFNEVKDKRTIPFFEGFALSVDVCVDTLHEWKSQHPEFSEAYKKGQHLQKQALMQGALQGLFNPTAFIFIAKNITDMRDRQEVEHSGEIRETIADLSQMTDAQIEKYAEKDV